MNLYNFQFEFKIGGFRSNCYNISNINKSVISLVSYSYGPFLYQLNSEPLDSEWTKFWNLVDKLDIWQWKKEYIEKEIHDGSEWELMIDRKGKKRRTIYGSNLYPKNFKLIVDEIKNLSKIEEDLF